MKISRFSSYPIRKFQLGSFQFTDGLLIFTNGVDENGGEEEAFRKLWESLPPVQKMQIKELDIGLANQVAKSFLAQQAGRVTRGADSGSSANEERAFRAQAVPKFGADSLPQKINLAALVTQIAEDESKPAQE